MKLLRRSYLTFWQYEAKEFLLSFIIAFLFYFVIFLINQLLYMAEEALANQAGFMDVFLLLVYSTPAIIAMTFPFASLVGAIMATGRLAADNELLVMQACGISKKTAFVPFLVLGLVFTIVSFTMNDYFLPLGTMNYSRLSRKLITKTPQMVLKPFSIKQYGDVIIVTGDMKDDFISDVLIIDKGSSTSSRMISAGSAILTDSGGESGHITLILEDVFIQEASSSDTGRYEYSNAKKMEYNILLSRFFDSASYGVGPREMASRDLWQIIKEREKALSKKNETRMLEAMNRRFKLMDEYLKASKDARDLDSRLARLKSESEAIIKLESAKTKDLSLDIYKIEFYKKLSIPSGAFVFIFLAFPLGALAKKNSRATGFGLGLLVSVAYWAMLIGGQHFSYRSQVSPFIAMWAPNLIVLLLSIPFLFRRNSA